MDPNTLLFGVLGVALGILAVWIFTVRYRAKVRTEASRIIEFAHKEASVDRKQQLAEADLEIRKQRQDLEQDMQRLKSELTERERALEKLEASAQADLKDLEVRSNGLSQRESETHSESEKLRSAASDYQRKLEELSKLDPKDLRKQLE
jgi:hypothetical protein